MKKTVLILMVLTILSKIIGFIREITLSYFYGVSSISDAYLTSITIPTVIFGFIASGIATGYIPMYSRIEKNGGIIEGNRYTSNLINILMLISTLIIVLGLLFTEPLVRVFASGFEGNTLELAVQFTRISLLSIYFSSLIYIFNGFLQFKGNYVTPALIGLPLNFFIITSIIISQKTNIMVLAIGNIVAIASQLTLLLPYVYKKGYRFRFIFDIKDENIINMAYIALPVILGVSINQINILVDKTMASGLAVGGISVLNYASRLTGFVQGILVTSIATVLYPTITKMATEFNNIGLKKSISEALNSISLLVIPATIGTMIFSAPIVRLLFGRGAFDDQAIYMTSNALFYYSLSMIAFGYREILAKTFYSLQNTKTPMINSAIGMGLNIVLNIILSKFMGISGLALATSIAAIFTSVILFINLRKQIGPFGIKNISITFIKILFSSLVMGLIAKLSFNLLNSIIDPNLSLILAISIGIFAYFIVIFFMKIEDVDTFVNTIKEKLKRNVKQNDYNVPK